MESEIVAIDVEESSAGILDSSDPGETFQDTADTVDANGIAGEPPIEGSAGEQAEATRPVERLMRLALSAQFFRGADGRFHARVPSKNQHEVVGLKSTAFRDWLLDAYVSAHQQLPPRRAVDGLVGALEARVRMEADRHAVYVRIGGGQEDDDASSYYLDLGDRSGARSRSAQRDGRSSIPRACTSSGRRGRCRYRCQSQGARSSCCDRLSIWSSRNSSF